MSIAYFKRFRLEVALYDLPPVPELPPGYFWVPWDEALIDLHAEVQHQSFCEELDSAIFPCFADRSGCKHLLHEIRSKPGFLPATTWLVACASGCCGTVQGVTERRGYGSIQNIGVVPGHRGRGLGTALLIQALHGFRSSGLDHTFLEVTAQNAGAVRLYQRRRTGRPARKPQC